MRNGAIRVEPDFDTPMLVSVIGTLALAGSALYTSQNPSEVPTESQQTRKELLEVVNQDNCTTDDPFGTRAVIQQALSVPLERIQSIPKFQFEVQQGKQ
ncbi:MAG: hypothetical protein WCJ84_03460 [Candidatus Peregrinibacteria bacterium]